MSSLPNSGGINSAPNRIPASKVIAGALANNRVAQSLIGALGAYSLNPIVATSTSQTTNFGSLLAGDFVVHIPVGSSSPLGNAAGYAILGASAVTNSVGSTTLTGNLGISPNGPSSVTGTFVVSGATNEGNAAAAAAQTSAQSAFTSMQTLGLAGTTIAAELGGQTLTPGNYQSATSFGLSLTSGHSTLTFNGAGTYILYSPSTLLTGASGSTDVPTMVLENGATAANIYWIVGSSATINQSTASIGATFVGNVLAEDSITVTQSSTVDGGLIALTAAVTISNPSTIVAESSSSAQASFSQIAVSGNLGMAAVVGDLYLDLQVVNLDANNPRVPAPPAQLTGRFTGDGGLEF